MALQSIEQQRAKAALAWAESFGGGVSSEALSAANAMPAMILINGLGQTAAFYKSKDKAHYTSLYNALADWLTQKDKPYFKGEGDLLKRITTCEVQTYRAAQIEALAYLQWVKKFAKAYAKGE